jgi:hypothetical protein
MMTIQQVNIVSLGYTSNLFLLLSFLPSTVLVQTHKKIGTVEIYVKV